MKYTTPIETAHFSDFGTGGDIRKPLNLSVYRQPSLSAVRRELEGWSRDVEGFLGGLSAMLLSRGGVKKGY